MNARIRLVPAPNNATLRTNSGVEVQSLGGVEFQIGDGPATITGGFDGQWETVSRPKRAALTRYVGRDPITQDVPLLIDGFAAERNIQGLVDAWLYWQTLTGPDNHPTVWKVHGPIHYPRKRWVIADIQFGDALRDARGELVRQEVTLKLMEFVTGDRLRVRRKPLKLKPRKEKVGAKVATKGLNCRQLAKKYYGTVKAAKPLGAAQKPPVKDMRKKLHRKIKLVRITIP